MTYRIIHADVLDGLSQIASDSIQCVVTSPPYWGLRNYQHDGQIGREKTPQEYVERMVAVFREVRRVLRDDGTVWLNLGDSFFGGGRGGNPPESVHQKQRTNHGSLNAPMPVPAGLKPKDLIGIPWRVAFALQADGWWLRSDIVWAKRNPMPESVRDRPTRSHEYIFLLTKCGRYFYDADAIKEPGALLSLKRIQQETVDELIEHRVRELEAEAAVMPEPEPCNHEWSNGGIIDDPNDAYCVKCGCSFWRYAFMECP